MVSPLTFVSAQPYFSFNEVLEITLGSENRCGTLVDGEGSWGLPSACHLLRVSYTDWTLSNTWLTQGHVQLGNGPVTETCKVKSRCSMWITLDDSILANSPADERELLIS